jgi:hypothetical protein
VDLLIPCFYHDARKATETLIVMQEEGINFAGPNLNEEVL